MVDFSHIVALIPKNRFLSKLEVLDLVAARSDFSGVWKVQLPKLFSLSKPVEVLGYSGWRLREAQKKTTDPILNFEELREWEREIIVWLTHTIKGRFLIGANGIFYFENPKEAILFKLTWG